MEQRTSNVILYVDDQPALPEGLQANLERDGYELLHTDDPEAAVHLAEERSTAPIADRVRPGRKHQHLGVVELEEP